MSRSTRVKFLNSGMRYAAVVFTTLLLLVLGYYMTFFGQSQYSQLHDYYIRTKQASVVMILNSKGSGGTGFIATGKSGQNYIITNGHVCELAENGKVLVVYHGDTFVLPVFKKYPYNDLCAIEAPTNSKPLGIASSYQIGQKIYVLGHPLLESTTRSEGELSGEQIIQIMVGIDPAPGQCEGPTYSQAPAPGLLVLFGLVACIRTLDAIASTTPILPGNSGSPVLNNYGNVVGVAFASVPEGIRSYFVGLEYLTDFLGGL